MIKKLLNKRKPGEFIFDICNVLIMALISVLCLFPIIHIIFASFSEPTQLLSHNGILYKPLGFTLIGYKLVFRDSIILRGYINTIGYVVIGTSLSTILTIMGGYALSRKNLLWGNVIMFFITFTMFFNGGIIPFYIVVQKLGMINTYSSVIIPTAVSAFNLIIMRTSFKEIPDSLEESALIDGANQFVIMWKIVMPLAKATVAVIVLLYAVNIWNSWFSASIFLRDRVKYPLQLILKEILVANDTSSVLNTSADVTGKSLDIYKPLVKYCTIVIATVPVLCFYPFVQKYFVKGMMIGSVKG